MILSSSEEILEKSGIGEYVFIVRQILLFKDQGSFVCVARILRQPLDSVHRLNLKRW